MMFSFPFPVRVMADEVEKAAGWFSSSSFKKDIEEVIAATVKGAVAGVVWSVCSDIIHMHNTPVRLPLTHAEYQLLSRFGRYQPMVQSFWVNSGWKQARTLAVGYGSGAGMSCAMKKLRGKEDLQTCMVATFTSSVTLSLMAGLRGPEVITFGVMFTLLGAGLLKACGEFSKVNADRVMFSRNTVYFTGNALLLHTGHRKEIDEEKRTRERMVQLMRFGDGSCSSKFM